MRSLAAVVESNPDDVEGMVALNAKYGTKSDPDSIARLAAEHGLVVATGGER